MDRYNSIIAKAIGKLNGRSRYAVTISKTCTLYSTDKSYVDMSTRWRKHEDAHKAQYEKYGQIKFLILYLWESCKHGYTNNKFEIEAREAERL